MSGGNAGELAEAHMDSEGPVARTASAPFMRLPKPIATQRVAGSARRL